jgi:major membrane immunogen (membrane-anchored lipoprotein)
MRRILAILVICALPLLSGCALNDLIFGLFSDHYSEGGYTQQDKQNHYDAQIQAAQGGYER